MSEKAILSIMAECFGIENRDTILKIALECTEGKDREKIVNFYDGFDASIKRDIAAIKEHGIDYYVNDHAKAYINAGYEPKKTQEFIIELKAQIVWGLDDDACKSLLENFFTAIKFNFIYVNKKQFVINALKIAGREPVKYLHGITPEYVREIRREMQNEPSTPFEKWVLEKTRTLTHKEHDLKCLETYYRRETLGQDRDDIAKEMNISKHTIKDHREKAKRILKI